MTKTCAYCGKPFEVDGSDKNQVRRIYCGEFCKIESANEKKRERIKIGKQYYNVECEICGKVFLTNRSVKKTCSPECRHERDLRLKRENHRKHRELIKEGNAIRFAKQEQKKVETLEEVQRKARTMGLTYGKYMEQQYLKKLQEEREKNGRG